MVMRARMRSTVNVCCSLLERRMMISVPVNTSTIAVISYFGTNFSPSHLVEMKTFMRTAEDELHAIKVRSQKGSATKCPNEPTMTKKRPQMPFSEQNMFF